MQWGWAHRHIAANPASVVDHILPKRSEQKEHRRAMPLRDVPAFVQEHVADLAERALAHTVANKVEAAYHRTDLLE
jgi:hypothetical protein